MIEYIIRSLKIPKTYNQMESCLLTGAKNHGYASVCAAARYAKPGASVQHNNPSK